MFILLLLVVGFARVLGPSYALAQDGHSESVEFRLTATVDPPIVEIGDPLVYNLVLEGNTQLSENPLPEFPSFEPLQQLHVSTSQQVVFINRGVQQSVTYTVHLRPTREGQFDFGPSRIRVGNSMIESNAVTVAVARYNPGVSEEVAKSLEGFISARTNNADINKQIRGKFFLYTEFDKTTAVPFEPVLARTYVYKAPGLVQGEQYGFANIPPPTPSGYMRIEGYRSPPARWELIEIAGHQFQRALVEEVALIPTRTGALEYAAWTLMAVLPVRGGRNDPFGDPFFGIFGQNRLTAELPPPLREITIRPLPQPRPARFSNIVGNFDVRAEVDRDEVKEGEIVAYRLVFNGRGYADAIPEPAFSPIEGFSLFDKNSEVRSQLGEKGLVGLKTFEFFLRATRPGEHTLPAREFVLYDPFSESYVSRATEPIPIVVHPGEGLGIVEIARASQNAAPVGEVRQLATDIAHIHTGTWAPSGSSAVALYTRVGWWGLHLVPPVLLAGALIARRRRDFYAANPNARRRHRAQREAQRRLQTARKFLESDPDRFHAEIAAAIRGFLGDTLGREPSGLTNEDINRFLLLRMVPEEVRAYALRMLEYCDTARYAPGAADPQTRHATIESAEEVLRRLRESLS